MSVNEVDFSEILNELEKRKITSNCSFSPINLEKNGLKIVPHLVKVLDSPLKFSMNFDVVSNKGINKNEDAISFVYKYKNGIPYNISSKEQIIIKNFDVISWKIFSEVIESYVAQFCSDFYLNKRSALKEIELNDMYLVKLLDIYYCSNNPKIDNYIINAYSKDYIETEIKKSDNNYVLTISNYQMIVGNERSAYYFIKNNFYKISAVPLKKYGKIFNSLGLSIKDCNSSIKINIKNEEYECFKKEIFPALEENTKIVFNDVPKLDFEIPKYYVYLFVDNSNCICCFCGYIVNFKTYNLTENNIKNEFEGGLLKLIRKYFRYSKQAYNMSEYVDDDIDLKDGFQLKDFLIGVNSYFYSALNQEDIIDIAVNGLKEIQKYATVYTDENLRPKMQILDFNAEITFEEYDDDKILENSNDLLKFRYHLKDIDVDSVKEVVEFYKKVKKKNVLLKKINILN